MWIEDKNSAGNISHYDTIDGSFWMGHKLKVNSKDNTITIKSIKDSWDREEVVGKIRHFENDHMCASLIEDRKRLVDDWIKENL